MKTMKKNGGFTLVELIVVIAILAILAAVAIPAYSGYIQKAEEANDLQLLSALSTSFGSACLENDIYDMDTMVGTQFVLKNGLITGLTLPGGASANVTMAAAFTADQAQAILNSFALYYGDNMTTPFKVYVLIAYTEDGFVGYDAEEAEDKIIENLKNVITNSTFNGKLDILTEDVGSLIDILSDYLGEAGIEAVEGTGFETYLENVLGLSDADKEDSNKMANAAVLYLANAAANMGEDSVLNAKMTLADAMFTGDLSNVVADLSADTGSGLASYAMLYATAEALALKEGPGTPAYEALKGENVSINDPVSVINAVSAVFNAVSPETIEGYIGEGDGSEFDNDMNAYFETMKTVNSKENELKNELGSGGLLTENDTVKELLEKLQGK